MVEFLNSSPVSARPRPIKLPDGMQTFVFQDQPSVLVHPHPERFRWGVVWRILVWELFVIWVGAKGKTNQSQKKTDWKPGLDAEYRGFAA